MKKITTLFAMLLLCAVTATAQNGVKLTFDRSGTTPNDVTVNVTDLSGAALTGVTATLESTSITAFKTGNATALSRTTNSVLAPQTGYNNTQNESIWYVFKIEGLTSAFEYVYSAVDVYALNGQGNAQGNGGTTVREWDIEVATGNSAANVAAFTSLTNKDICTVTESDGNLYHKSWEAEGTATAATNPIYVKVTLTKRASLGCFAGIGSVSLKAEDLTQYRDALQDAITAANSLPTGEGPNKYTVTGGSDELNAAVAAGEAELNKDESEQTKASLVAARTAIETALGNLTKTLNQPEAGFYRIKGKTTGKYLAAGNASNGKFNMSDATDNTTLFCFDGTKLINYSTGLANGMNKDSWDWVYGNENVSTVTFEDGETNGGYLIKSNNAYFFDGGTSADRGQSYDNRAQYRSWYLEPVTALTITLSEVNGKYYRTFSAPVDIASIEGATMYDVTVAADNKTASTVDMDLSKGLKAGNGVVLIGSNATATATIGAANDDATTNLKPQYASEEAAAHNDVGHFFLGTKTNKNNEKVVGFYKLKSDGGKTGAFRAYIEKNVTVSGDAKEGFDLVFGGDVTGVETIDNGQLTIDNSAVFNLQGQRVNKAQKGVFIQNGKKVVLK